MQVNNFPKIDPKNDPLIQQLFASIPPQTAATFTESQLAEIKQVFQSKFGNCYAVDIRFSILLPKQRLPIILLFNQGKRCKKRLQYPVSRYANRVLFTRSGLVISTSLMETHCLIEIVPKIGRYSGRERRNNIIQYLNASFQIECHHRKH